jgi:hypothetical protein
MRARRGGFGLPAVLAVLAVSAVAGIGILRVAWQRLLDAHDAVRLVRVQVAAESAVRLALASWDADSMRNWPAGAVRPLPSAIGTLVGPVSHWASAERIGRSRFLLQAEAATPAGSARALATATVAMIPTDEIWRDFHAAVAAGGNVLAVLGAVVDGRDGGAPPAWSPADCPAGLAATVAALLGAPDRPGVGIPASGAALTATGATLSGLPPVWTGAPRTDSADFLRLGTLPLSDVAAIADRVENSTVHLAPAAPGGVCDGKAPGNWGAPASAAHPCFGFVPLVYAPSGLEVASGTGQGILVANGNVVLRPGVAFTGLILATGLVELDGASVIGAVRARAGARVDGSVRYSTCAVGRTLDRARALRHPVRLGDRLWLPAFR